MATVTARYTNPIYQINLTPHPDYGNGIIAQVPTLRLARSESFIERVSVAPNLMVATNNAGQKIYFSGLFGESFETSDFTEALNRASGVITEVADTLYEQPTMPRITISDINIDARTFMTSTTWTSLLVGNDLLVGGPGNDVLVDRSGLNRFEGGGGDDVCHGGSGIDTAVFVGLQEDYSLSPSLVSYSNQQNLAGVLIRDRQSGRDGEDELVDIERLRFADLNLALDTAKGEIAGSAYRLYKAAFDRTPDAEGLGFWIASLDSGVNLTSAAQGFINSAEFKAMYGANATDEHFVTLLYNHVLHRNPEGAGYQFWLDSLDVGASRAQVLQDFSESTENINQTAGLIANGIQYQEWM